jgi:glycosyltransferase involved in cell wall biosynthesis
MQKDVTIKRVNRTNVRNLAFILKRGVREGIKQVLKARERGTQVTLSPPTKPVGRVLLSFVNPRFLGRDAELPNTHSEFWESIQMAGAFLDRGYAVDWINYHNDVFEPSTHYAFFIDTRRNMQRLAPKLNVDCVKIMHINTSHMLFHNAAGARRLLELQQRRGITLTTGLYEFPNLAFEHCDCATLSGNSVAAETFAYLQKPIFKLPVTAPAEFDWSEDKDFEKCRNNFVWFGSRGLVHKGLDLVLEAFAGMPDCRLTVCGPISSAPEFERAFKRELYDTPNITTLGWVNVAGDRFREVLQNSVGLVYPSCSEGQSGGVVTCMFGGLIPIVSRESGVDVADEFGRMLSNCSVDEIRRVVQEVKALPAAQLKQMAFRAWQFAQDHNSRSAFLAAYDDAVNGIMELANARRLGAGSSLEKTAEAHAI